jgi:hypothetical protein
VCWEYQRSTPKAPLSRSVWFLGKLCKLRVDFIGALRVAQVFDIGNETVWQEWISTIDLIENK